MLQVMSLNWANTNNPLGIPVLSPIRNQGLCGACWAFVAVGAVEASIRIKMRRKFVLSPQELLDCDRRSNKGCSGGDPASAFRYIISNGLSLYDDYPYSATDGVCQPSLHNTRAFITGIITIAPYSEISLLSALTFIGPIATGICGTDKSFMYYQSGVFSNSRCCTEQNHAVLVIGYGKRNSPQLVGHIFLHS
jgi:C1A family cysteine protease